MRFNQAPFINRYQGLVDNASYAGQAGRKDRQLRCWNLRNPSSQSADVHWWCIPRSTQSLVGVQQTTARPSNGSWQKQGCSCGQGGTMAGGCHSRLRLGRASCLPFANTKGCDVHVGLRSTSSSSGQLGGASLMKRRGSVEARGRRDNPPQCVLGLVASPLAQYW